jgi:hypothetical protein
MTPDSETSRMMRINWRTRRCIRGVLAFAACAGITGMGVGCHGEDAVVANPDGSVLLWSVTNDVGAVTMEAGTTYQLVLTPRYPAGDSVPELSPTSFVTGGPTKVTVSPTGLLTALEATDVPVQIIGTYTLDGVSVADTVMVAVTDGRERVKSLSMQGVTTTIPVYTYPSATAVVTDSSDNTLYDIPVSYSSSNPAVAYFDAYGTLTAASKGVTTLFARATAYGVTYTDSVTITIINPVSVEFDLFGSFWQEQLGFSPLSPSLGVIGVGGTVTFAAYDLDAPSSITFLTGGDSLPAGANIPEFTQDSTIGPFLVPGSYLFKIASGDTARVVVLP